MTKSTDYLGNFVYEDNILKYILTAEGKIAIDEVASPDYQYFLKDHLGNTRVVFNSDSVLQASNYYPFGMLMENFDIVRPLTGNENKYLYNGKALQTDFGLDWYDYGARFYDAALGRWHVRDPLAEKYYDFSSYCYVANNPLNLIDPDDRDIEIITERDDDGNVTETLTYKEGELYNKNGDVYEGNNMFASEIKETLNSLLELNDSEVSNVVGELENSDNTHWVEEDPFGGNRVKSTNYVASDKGEASGSHIMVSLDRETIEKDLSANKETTLGHELKHSYDYDKGNMKGQAFIEPSAKSPAEISAVNLENRIRHKQKLPLRKTYGQQKIDPTKLKDPRK